jgi:mannose/fructose/N-acetylgalactosamine-specific phosphotransferase system component IIB
MNQEEAKARAEALLNVIENAYAIRIINIDEVVKAITEKTCDEQKILTICTALNTWVAINAGLSGEFEIPLDVVNGFAGKVIRL